MLVFLVLNNIFIKEKINEIAYGWIDVNGTIHTNTIDGLQELYIVTSIEEILSFSKINTVLVRHSPLITSLIISSNLKVLGLKESVLKSQFKLFSLKYLSIYGTSFYSTILIFILFFSYKVI